jgi:hypothetical protein
MRRTLHAIAFAILLLFGSLPLVGAQSTPPGGQGELSYTDPKGDAGLFGLSPAVVGGAGQPTPATDPIDMVSFRLYGEDQEGLYMEIGVNGIKPNPPQTLEFGNYANFETTFRLDGTQMSYRLRMQVTSALARTPTGQAPMPASLCVSENVRGGGCNSQRVFATLDWDKSLMTAYLTKQSLMGQDPVGNAAPPANPPRLEVGSRVVEIRTAAYGGLFGGLFSDYMPNQGGQGPYVMQAKAANDRLRLRLHNEKADEGGRDPFQSAPINDFPTAAVSPGTTSLIQVAVENWNSGKRLINLSAQIVDSKDAAKWEARIVPTITVPGEDRRIVNLIVNLTGNVAHRESTLLRITARSLGFADEIGVMKLKLVAAVPPSPRSKDLFFHIGGQPASTTYFCFGCQQPSWLNTLEQDPLGTQDAGAGFTSQRSGGLQNVEFTRTFNLDAPLNEDLVLNTRDPITATLGFRSDLPFQGTAKIEISAGDVFIGQGEAPWTGQPSVQITLQPALEAERIPTGTLLTVRIGLATTQPGPGTFISLQDLRPEFVPKASKLSLPIVPDPKPRVKTAIPAGPAFLTLNLDGDAEEFVNPGKVRVFKLTVINEGVQEDLVGITLLKDPENWYVAVNPSESYRLKPGESASFGVLVKPPAGAKEGEQAHIQVNATSKADPSALVQAALTAIVTTGVEIDDESDNFTADDDTISHVEEAPHKKSPGLGVLAVAAVGALVVVVRRRREA